MESNKLIALVLFCLMLTGGIYFFIIMKKREKEQLIKLKEKKQNEVKEREELKEKNPEKFKEIIKNQEKKKEEEIIKDKLYKKARIGAFLFAIPHLLFEIVFSELGQPVYGPAINLGIALIIIKNLIFKRNMKNKNPGIQGFLIALTVFIARVIFGVLYLGVS